MGHPSRIGQTLGRYRIMREIGAGGMGVVCEAEDLTLARRVALKMLPPEVATDPERRARLMREARTLAALNHPNIVTVHSVEEADGQHFITMELVNGKSLATLLSRDGMALDRFFESAIPLTDAIAVAHQHGVVHRDLKPENVMVTDEGSVKVLDFGLAKSERRSDSAVSSGQEPTVTLTEAGTVLGTWRYMSPEQARGETIDSRSDIFTLGVMFYEMLAGRTPFVGKTPSDLVSSILKDEPPPLSSLRENIPPELAKLVRRCLAKVPSRRMQSAVDVRIELEDLKRELDSGELVVPSARATSRPAHRKAILVALVAAAILTLSLVAWPTTGRGRPLELHNAHQVTFAVGAELQPAWSPDGGRIVYTAGGHIWIVQATGGPAVNLTRDHAGSYNDPAWSPDGSQIAFISQREGVFVMPAIGGSPTRVSAGAFARGPQWSPDGSELAYLGGGDGGSGIGNFVAIVSLRTRETRQIRIPGDAGNRWDLSWSPDGRFFAYVRAPNRTEGISRIWVLRTFDHQQTAVTDGNWNDWSPTWSADGRSLFYVSNRGGTMDLWQQRVSESGTAEGAPSLVTAGVGVQQASFSRDGRRLVYSQGRPVANLWRVPIRGDRAVGWDDAEQLTFDQALLQGVDVFPGNDRVVFASDRGGNPNLWTMTINSDTIARLTPDESADLAPSISPDGTRVAFYSYRGGSRDIWIVPAEGGPATQITRDPGYEMGPSWSPDGQAIAFWSDREGGVSDVFVLPLRDAQPRRVLKGPLYYPQWSPDGAWISASAERRFMRVSASGGTPEDLPFEVTQPYRWSRDGARVYFRREGQIWSVAMADGTERQVTALSPREGALGEYSLAVGLAHVYFTWRNDLGDIWVMDVANTSGK